MCEIRPSGGDKIGMSRFTEGSFSLIGCLKTIIFRMGKVNGTATEVKFHDYKFIIPSLTVKGTRHRAGTRFWKVVNWAKIGPCATLTPPTLLKALSGPRHPNTRHQNLQGMLRERGLKKKCAKSTRFSISKLNKCEDCSVHKGFWVSNRNDSGTRRNAKDAPKTENRPGSPEAEKRWDEKIICAQINKTWGVQNIILMKIQLLSWTNSHG